MTHSEIIHFVSRLERREVKFDEFRELTVADWEAIKSRLMIRSDKQIQNYVNAMFRFKKRMRQPVRSQPRTYSEAEIITELERLG